MIDALVLDLDGTIVDCAARHHACYADLARELGMQALDARTYWTMKRARAPWRAILAAAGGSADPVRFSERFVECIELPRYLALDRLYPGALEALGRLRAIAASVTLVTMRRDARQLEMELARLGITAVFDRVITLGANGVPSKGDIAAPFFPPAERRSAWIGDTEEDVSGARRIGALACAVCGGLRERRLLELERPDLIAPDILAAAAMLEASALSRENPA
jgi:phosphoglycolate phosphatase-like HAD superfamily hydrolase